MQEFQLTIFRQSRVLVILFSIPIISLSLLLLGVEIKSFLIPLLLFIAYLALARYYAIGHLNITLSSDGQLSFDWKKKLVFNYKPIPSIKIKDVKTIVLEQGNLLKKIKTSNTTVSINTSRIGLDNSIQFLNVFLKEAEKHDIKIINSWKELTEKGVLGIIYKINSIIVTLAILIVVIVMILKGFKPKLLFVMLLFIPQMILYGLQMKNEIKNNKTKNDKH